MQWINVLDYNVQHRKENHCNCKPMQEKKEKAIFATNQFECFLEIEQMSRATYLIPTCFNHGN